MAIYNVNKTTGDITETAGKYGSSNSVFYGTIAQWNALSTAEKKAYDHASIPDSLDGNVTFPASKVMLNSGDSVEEKIGNMRMTKLWENPDTTQSFGEQNINLSSGDYDLLLVIAKFHPTINRDISIIVSKGSNAYLNCSGYLGNNVIYTMYRTIEYVSDTKLKASPGNITGTVDNNRLIPYQIYGIKLT